MLKGRRWALYAYIGRQAIYNTVYNIAGYELLYRRNDQVGAAVEGMDGDEMTKSVLLDAANVFGIPNLTNGLPAYINFTRNLIMDDFAMLFDPNEIVVEVPGDIFVNDVLASKLSNLQRCGYKLSLNSYNAFNARIKFDSIINSFDVIRIDISKNNKLQIRDLLQRLRYSRAQLLAERVETQSDFEMVQSLKFTLFQGYYFERPNTVSKETSIADNPFGKLLCELAKPYPNFEQCCRLVYTNPMMAHMFLRKTFRAGYNRENLLSEIKRGMAVIGLDGLRRWTAIELLKQINRTATDELSRRAYLRGRFVERLLQHANTELAADQGFYVGMGSLLDQITGVPMDNVLNELHFSPAVDNALRWQQGSYVDFLNFARSYEQGNAKSPASLQLRLTDRQVSNLYMQCMAETDSSFSENEPSTLRSRH